MGEREPRVTHRSRARAKELRQPRAEKQYYYYYLVWLCRCALCTRQLECTRHELDDVIKLVLAVRLKGSLFCHLYV